MKKMTVPLAVALVLTAAGCGTIERSRSLANPAVSGQTLAQQVCSICHGVDGQATSPQFPRLAGQQKDYIVTELKNFRGKGRSDPPGPEYMWGLARSLTDKQIDELAEYFSSQSPMKGTPIAVSSMDAGKKIFTEGIPAKGVPPCIACHGDEAQGRDAFPRLAGQHTEYLLRELHIFKETNFRPDTPMSQVTHDLSPQEMQEVVSYLSTLSPLAAK
jgi:cytochrome c553